MTAPASILSFHLAVEKHREKERKRESGEDKENKYHFETKLREHIQILLKPTTGVFFNLT